MKSFNRRSSRSHHGSKRRTLTWMAHIHAHTFHLHSYNHVVRSASSAITELGMDVLFWRYLIVHIMNILVWLSTYHYSTKYFLRYIYIYMLSLSIISPPRLIPFPDQFQSLRNRHSPLYPMKSLFHKHCLEKGVSKDLDSVIFLKVVQRQHCKTGFQSEFVT